MSVICVGDLCCDLIVPYGEMKTLMSKGEVSKAAASRMHVRMQCGGSVGNTARSLGELGAKPFFISPVREDELGLFLKKEMELAGVDMSLAAESEKSNMYCVAVLDAGGERTMFCFIPPWADYPRFKRDSFTYVPSGGPDQIIFLSGMIFLDDPEHNAAVLDFVNRQKADGSTVIFDLNVRPESYGYDGTRKEYMDEMIRISDIILGSGRDEFYAVTMCMDLEKAAERVFDNSKRAVIARDGGNPILILHREIENGTVRAKTETVPVKSVRVKSTLGAGDFFDAMFIKKISEGSDIREAVRSASDYAGVKISS